MRVSFDTPTQVTINDKRDDFTFRIVTFPFMCSNVPAVLAYGIYISQLVRMGRICDRYEDFVRKNKEVTTRLMNRVYSSLSYVNVNRRYNHISLRDILKMVYAVLCVVCLCYPNAVHR